MSCCCLVACMAPSLRAMNEARRQEAMENPTPGFGGDLNAQFNISSGLTIAGVILGAVVGLSVLAALAPTWFDSVGDLSENFTDADLDNDAATVSVAENIAQNVFPLIIGLLGVFAIAGLAFAAMKLRGGRGGT